MSDERAIIASHAGVRRRRLIVRLLTPAKTHLHRVDGALDAGVVQPLNHEVLQRPPPAVLDAPLDRAAPFLGLSADRRKL